MSCYQMLPPACPLAQCATKSHWYKVRYRAGKMKVAKQHMLINIYENWYNISTVINKLLSGISCISVRPSLRLGNRAFWYLSGIIKRVIPIITDVIRSETFCDNTGVYSISTVNLIKQLISITSQGPDGLISSLWSDCKIHYSDGIMSVMASQIIEI